MCTIFYVNMRTFYTTSSSTTVPVHACRLCEGLYNLMLTFQGSFLVLLQPACSECFYLFHTCDYQCFSCHSANIQNNISGVLAWL